MRSRKAKIVDILGQIMDGVEYIHEQVESVGVDVCAKGVFPSGHQAGEHFSDGELFRVCG